MNRRPSLAIYGPPGMTAITNRLFSDDGAFVPTSSRARKTRRASTCIARGGQGEGARPAPQIRELTAGGVVEGGGWTGRAVEVHHFAPHLTSLGYRLDADGQSFVYSGD